MSEYSIRKIDSSAGITDVRYVEYTTILVPKSGGTFTGNVISPAFSATTYSGVTFYGDGTNLTGIASVTDFDGHTGDTTIHYTKGSINLSDLGSSAHTHPISEVVNLQSELDSKVNTYSTGGTYNSATDIITITNSTGGTFDITGVSDTFVTGQTFNNGNYQLTTVLNDATTFISDLSILSSDMVVTGGTYDIDTGVVTFTNNSGNTFEVSGFTTGMTDSFTTSATLSGDSITFNNNIYGANYYNVDLNPLLSGKTDVSLFNTYTGDTATELTSKALQTDFVTHSGDTSIHFTKESLDSLFVNVTGDTMTGTLTVNNGNINIGTNANFFQGTSTGATNVSLIGVDSQDRIYIGNQGYLNYITDDTTVKGVLSANTLYLMSAATLNASATDILVRNSTTGEVQYKPVSSITADTFVTAFTYDNVDELTIKMNNGSAYTASLTALTTNLTDTIVVGENVASGDLVYLKTDSKYWKADNAAEATSSTELRLVTETILADASGESLKNGQYITTGLTTGSTYWVGTGGTISASQPTANESIVRYVGTALNGTTLEFNPDELFVEISTNPNQVTNPAYRTVTSSGNILATDWTVDVITTGDTTQTLPTSVGIAGRVYNVKNSDTTSTSTVTLVGTGGQTMDGETSITFQFPVNITVQSNGSNWILI